MRGGVGIDLTRASRVFMMDLWWNAGTEEQAFDRVHRIGQTRPVTIVRYVTERTIETRILELQRRKAALAEGALARLDDEAMRRARCADLRRLLEDDGEEA